MTDNKELIHDAKQAAHYADVRNITATLVKRLVTALEAAEAELTRRDTAIARASEQADQFIANARMRYEEDNEDAVVDLVSVYGKLSMRAAVMPIDQNLVAQSDAFYAVWEAIRAALALVPVPLEVVRAQAFQDGYQRGIDAARAAFPRTPEGAAAPVSLEAVKAETTTDDQEIQVEPEYVVPVVARVVDRDGKVWRRGAHPGTGWRTEHGGMLWDRTWSELIRDRGPLRPVSMEGTKP